MVKITPIDTPIRFASSVNVSPVFCQPNRCQIPNTGDHFAPNTRPYFFMDAGEDIV